jgi:UDP-glucose 4-epimerase
MVQNKTRELKGKRIAVVGGFGFIGSHLANELCKNNDVVAIGKTLHPHVHPKVTQLRYDILSDDFLTYLNRESFDIVIHLAGTSEIWPSFKNPEREFKLNEESTKRILECLSKKEKKPLFVYASTIGVYGSINRKINEQDDTIPLSPYGKSKLAADIHTQSYAKDNKLKTLILRYSGTYGPRQKKLFVYDLIKKHHDSLINKNKEPILIKGSGKQRRDINYVTNQVDATIASIEHAEFNGDIVNVGSGEEYALKEIAKKIHSYFSNAPDLKNEQTKREGDTPLLAFDTTKLQSYKYNNEISLQQGILNTSRWFKRDYLEQNRDKLNLSITVILPSYNEKKIIAATIKKTEQLLSTIVKKHEILVVDDSSPDGTADVVRQVMKSNSNVQLLVNPNKKGLGYAHKLGLDNAINDIICIMDSDGSPDVNTIIDFVYGIHTGYDMIIGSRFIPACTIIGQKWIKQYSSRLMNQVIRYLLGTKMNDNTHSYRAISRKAYNKVKDQVHDHHHPEFCLELTVKAQRAGLKVIEAPTDFIERDSGETKMPIASSGMRAIKKIFSLRFSK